MKKSTPRRALLTSAFAFVICISMFIGTTYAWFTDSATSANNIIQTGNLDLEVYYGDPANKNSITEVSSLFDDVQLWEPGAIAWENLTVVNSGSLALKYKLQINFTDENYIVDTGARLSQILRIAIVEGGVTQTDRAAVLQQAQESGKDTLLRDFTAGGNLLSKESKMLGIVIYWQSSANDNDYNVNNGKQTSDTLPLHITLGVNVAAWQTNNEKDSFGADYDAGLGETVVTNYSQLKEALKIGGTIIMGQDILIDAASDEEIAVVPAGVTASLDLYGYSLYAPDGVDIYAINNLGDLTVLDSVGGGSIVSNGINNGNANARSVANASLTVESGTFTSVSDYAINNYSAMTVNDGYINGGIYNSAATLEINGGTFHNDNADKSTVFADNSSTVTIKDGIFSIGTAAHLLDSANESKYVIEGGQFDGGFRGAYEISGGTFENSTGTSFELTDPVITDGAFIGVNPAELYPAFAEENSEYIAINYGKPTEDAAQLAPGSNTGILFKIIKRENAYIYAAPNSVGYEPINQNYDVTALAAGGLSTALANLKSNEFSAVYLLPGTYNEASPVVISSNMEVIGVGDRDDVKIIKGSASSRHLINVSHTGQSTNGIYIHVSLRNLYLDASLNTTSGKDNAAVQAIGYAKVKCYDLTVVKSNNMAAIAFYVNNNSESEAASMYVENCQLNAPIEYCVVTTSSSGYRFFHYGLTYNNGVPYSKNSGNFKNVKLEADDWDWDN